MYKTTLAHKQQQSSPIAMLDAVWGKVGGRGVARIYRKGGLSWKRSAREAREKFSVDHAH